MHNPIILVTLVNFFLNFAIQSSIIFLPILGDQLGASDFEVGLIGAFYGGSFLISSLYSGRQSDKKGRLGFVQTGLFLSVLAYASQLFADNMLVLYIARAAVGLTQGITVAALVAYAYESGSDMGKFSSYGSLGWIAGALTSAVFNEIQVLFIISAFIACIAFILSFLFPKQITVLPTQNKNPRYLSVLKQGFPIYLSVFLRHLGATSVWIVLPLYFEKTLGLERFWVGLLWGLNFTVQFIVMRYLEKYNPYKVFAVGQILSIGVFASYALLENLFPLIITQIGLGVAWAFLYVGALVIVLRTGEERGTASGMFQATINLCGAIGPFLGGSIAQFWGYRGVMAFAALIGIAGMLVALPQAKEQA